MTSLSAKAIAEAFFQHFAQVGISQIVRCDAGSAFKSARMKAFVDYLGIEVRFATTGHHQTQGLVERGIQIFENLLKPFMVENATTWDKIIPWVCLGHNEMINETTVFSPAEIIFGRNIRGPLYVMRDRWVDGVQSEIEQTKEVSAYMTELKATLQDVAERAKENARKAQINYKKYFDRKSSERKLKPGDRVLVL